MADLGYGSFNFKDPNAWAQFKQQGAAGTTGINAMPYVLGGAVPYTWLGGQDRTVPEIHSWLYGGGGGGGAAPAPSSSLAQLLGLVGGGGAAASAGGAAPAGGDANYSRGGPPPDANGRVPIPRIPGLTLNAAIGEPGYSWNQDYYQY